MIDKNFNKSHYDQMISNNDDWKRFTEEELREEVRKGAELVEKNKGFYGLENTATDAEMISLGALIDFRLAKEDLGEYVEEIDT